MSTRNDSKTQFTKAARNPQDRLLGCTFGGDFTHIKVKRNMLLHDMMQIALMRASPVDESLWCLQVDSIRSAACSFGCNFVLIFVEGIVVELSSVTRIPTLLINQCSRGKMMLRLGIAGAASNLITKEQRGHARSNSCAEIFCFG